VRIVHESGAQPYSAERVLAEFLGNGPAVASPARSATPASLGSVPAGVRHMPDAQRVELFDALRFLAERGSTWSPDDRSAWVRVGAALAEFGQAGLEIWTEWSRQSSKFDEVDQRRTWATLKPATGTNHLRVESIFLAAHALGWSAPATKENLPAPRKPALRVFDRYTKHEPTRFAVDRIFPRRAVTLWSGHGGVGKSTLLLGACACFAASTSWFGLAVEGGRALYLSLEDEGATVAERLDRLIPAYDLDPDRVYPNLTTVDAPESTRAALISECYSDRGGLTVERTETFFELREMARGHDLIVIDGLSDAFDFEINTGRYSKKAIAALTDLARECNAAVVLVCHVNRQTVQQGTRGHSYAGSAALHNAARSRVAIIRDQRSGEAVTLEHEKSNYGPLIQPLEITVSTEGVPRLADIDHVPDITAEARTCAAAIVAKSDAEHILAAMRAAIAQGERVSAARTGPKTAQHVLATFDELPTDLRGRSGRERFWRGWDRLVKDGRVAVIGRARPVPEPGSHCDSDHDTRGLRQREGRGRRVSACVRKFPPYPPAINARGAMPRCVLACVCVSSREPTQINACTQRLPSPRANPAGSPATTPERGNPRCHTRTCTPPAPATAAIWSSARDEIAAKLGQTDRQRHHRGPKQFVG
jgi:RecA-family ATPase